MTGARELDGERGTPGSGAQHGDGFVSDVVASQGVERRARGGVWPRLHDARQLTGPCAAAWAACCCNPLRKSWSKSTGGRTKFGKPPCVTSCDTATRAYGNSTFGQIVPIARRWSSGVSPRIANRPACFTSTRNAVVSPCLAPTVTVNTTSLSSGATDVAAVLMSSEICGLQLPSTRGPFGASYEQSLRYTDWMASIGPFWFSVAAGAVGFSMIKSFVYCL